MATARKLPSGSWRCLVYGGMKNGKRHYVSITGKSKKEAELKAAQYLVEHKKDQHNMTLGEAIDKYISSRCNTLSPNTIKDYRNTRRLHVQGIMNIDLYKLTSEDIQQAINIDAQSLSPKTIRNINGLITATLSAYRPEFHANITLPKRERVNYCIPVDEDIKRLMNDVSGTEMELPILLAAFGTMRRGEICALDAKNINGNIVHVCSNMVQDNNHGWMIKTPKSYAGDRFIDYPDFVAKLWEGKTGRIVPMTPTALSRRYDRIRARLKLSFRFHDLRHYSASIQHAIGIPDAYIMQRGGWASDAVLKQVYRHALEDKTREMNEKINSYFEKMQHEMQHA